jgi:hypothetical protein
MSTITYVLLGIVITLFVVEWILIGQLLKAKDDTISRLAGERQYFRDLLNDHLKRNHESFKK